MSVNDDWWADYYANVKPLDLTPRKPAPFKPNEPHTVQNTRLEYWAERDRQHVALYSQNDVLLVEWWDEAVSEAIDDGFLKVDSILGRLRNTDKLHASALEYYLAHLYPHTGTSIKASEPDDEAEPEQTEFVLNTTFDRYATRQQNRRLKERDNGPTATTISNHIGLSHVVEVQSDKKGCIVRCGWREAMRDFVDNF